MITASRNYGAPTVCALCYECLPPTLPLLCFMPSESP